MVNLIVKSVITRRAGAAAIGSHRIQRLTPRFMSLTVPEITYSNLPRVLPEKNAPKCILGDSPRWCEDTQTLIYVDICGKSVHNYNPVTGVTQSMNFDQQVGFAIPTVSTKKDSLFLYVGLEDRIVEVDMTRNKKLSVIAQVPSQYYREQTRFNDAECTPEGILYAGFMHCKWREGFKGNVFQLPLGNGLLTSIFTKGDPVHVPNGFVWLDKVTLYLVDSNSSEIWEMKFDEQMPTKLVKRHVVFTLADPFHLAGHMLDGMTMDSTGCLWVAVTGGGYIIRVDPRTGTELARIKMPFKKPTALVFGESLRWNTIKLCEN